MLQCYCCSTNAVVLVQNHSGFHSVLLVPQNQKHSCYCCSTHAVVLMQNLHGVGSALVRLDVDELLDMINRDVFWDTVTCRGATPCAPALHTAQRRQINIGSTLACPK